MGWLFSKRFGVGRALEKCFIYFIVCRQVKRGGEGLRAGFVKESLR